MTFGARKSEWNLITPAGIRAAHIDEFCSQIAGFLGTNENAYYAYGGFGIDGYYGKKKNFVVTPSLACGYYKDGNEIKAGNPLEFYIGIDILYRFKNNSRIGVGIFHISNADSGKKNQGSENLVLKYQIPMGR